VPSIDGHAGSGAKIPLLWGFMASDSVPEALYAPGMGPRNQARRLPADCKEAWKPGSATVVVLASLASGAVGRWCLSQPINRVPLSPSYGPQRLGQPEAVGSGNAR
jgi:hypothetical protein